MATKFSIVGSGPWGKKVEDCIKAMRLDATVEMCSARGDAFLELIMNCDIAFVAAHPDVNPRICEYAFLQGKPVIVEKPVALTYYESTWLRKLSEQHQVSFVVDYTHTFDVPLMALRKCKIEHLEITMGGPGPVRSYDALWDYGSHAVAVMLSLIPDRPVKLMERKGDFFQFFCGNTMCVIHVSNTLPEKECRVNAIVDDKTVKWNDSPYRNPLGILINTMVQKHQRGEYWSNGVLAVEVTELLERMHRV